MGENMSYPLCSGYKLTKQLKPFLYIYKNYLSDSVSSDQAWQCSGRQWYQQQINVGIFTSGLLLRF